MKTKMNAKNLMVSFVAIVTFLFLVNLASAYTVTPPTGGLASSIYEVEIDGQSAASHDISVTAGETIPIKVYFISAVNASDVRVKAEIEGDKVDVDDRTSSFDVEEGKAYKKTLTLKVPYELKDELSKDITLNIEIWNGDYKSEINDITLGVQRPTYNADIMSVSTQQNVEAGETIPVDIVLKNVGYNNLDDLYITVKIPALEIQRTSYFGDLVALECDSEGYDEDLPWSERSCDEDDQDATSGRLYLEIPYDAKEGIYTLEIEAKNSDLTVSETKQININNDFSAGNVIVDSAQKSAAVGENVEFNLVLVNPTNKLKVYRIVPESFGSLESSVSQSVIAVPAGSSNTVSVIANAKTEGEQSFDVTIFSGEEITDTVKLSVNASGSAITSSVAILTIILAIVFLVLLVILIVLLGKKPEKSEDFGESYY